MNKEVHYFIAIPLPKELQAYYANWQSILKKDVSYKQWPHPEDLHITLKFLGGVERLILANLSERLKEIENLPSFTLETGGIGTFGKTTSPRVLWAGVKNSSPLQQLYERIELICGQYGFTKEKRPYRPHITLAKKWDDPSKIGNIDDVKKQFSGQKRLLHVRKVVLYKIEPQQTPKYKVVHTYDVSGEKNGSIN